MSKIVFFDIDGTLVDFGKVIPTSTKEAIQQLKENGIIPAIATGRAPSMFKDILEELDIHTYIAMNGQYVVYENEVVFESPLPDETVKKLATIANDRNLGLIFCTNEEIVGNSLLMSTMGVRRSLLAQFRPYISKIAPKLAERIIHRRAFKRKVRPNMYEGKTIYQCVVNLPEQYDKEYQKEFPECHFTRSNPYSVDILSKGVSKAIGIQKLIDHLNISITNTVAFGDGLNDLEMIQATGIGVAMGNGRSELKALANMVTDSVDNDGIQKGLQKLNLIP